MKDVTDPQKADEYTKLGVFCVAQEFSLWELRFWNVRQHNTSRS